MSYKSVSADDDFCQWLYDVICTPFICSHKNIADVRYLIDDAREQMVIVFEFDEPNIFLNYPLDVSATLKAYYAFLYKEIADDDEMRCLDQIYTQRDKGVSLFS